MGADDLRQVWERAGRGTSVIASLGADSSPALLLIHHTMYTNTTTTTTATDSTLTTTQHGVIR